MTIKINKSELLFILNFLDEVEALLDADVACDVFMQKHEDLLASSKQIIKEKLGDETTTRQRDSHSNTGLTSSL